MDRHTNSLKPLAPRRGASRRKLRLGQKAIRVTFVCAEVQQQSEIHVFLIWQFFTANSSGFRAIAGAPIR